MERRSSIVGRFRATGKANWYGLARHAQDEWPAPAMRSPVRRTLAVSFCAGCGAGAGGVRVVCDAAWRDELLSEVCLVPRAEEEERDDREKQSVDDQLARRMEDAEDDVERHPCDREP